MNVRAQAAGQPDMVGTIPSARNDKAFNPERAARAFHHVADLEGDLNRIVGVLRAFFMLDYGAVFRDNDDACAFLQLVYTADEAMGRVWAKRSAACDELHPFAYPDRHGWEVA